MFGDVRKVSEFFRPQPLDSVRFEPWPRRRPGYPYFLTNPVANNDGHGGYTRRYRFDASGVPYREVPQGREYDPLVVARYALKMLAAAREGNGVAGVHAARVLPALVASGLPTGTWSRGPGADAMRGASPSGLTQGVVLSAILRLCEGRPAGAAGDVIERAFSVLASPLEGGGTVSRLGTGAFIEEFPRTPPSHILNGCIYGLFGVYDLADALAHRGAAALARDVESTIGRAAASFTTSFGWSRYALDVYGHRPVASAHYHRAHVGLVSIVADRTGDAALRSIAARWQSAYANTLTRAFCATLKTAQAVVMRRVRRLPLRRG